MKMASRKSLSHFSSSISTARTQFQDFSQTGAYLMSNIKEFGFLANPCCFSSISPSRRQIRSYPIGNLSQESVLLLQMVKKFGSLSDSSSHFTTSAQIHNYPVGNLSRSNVFQSPERRKFGFLTNPCRNFCTNVEPQPPSEPPDSSEGKEDDKKKIKMKMVEAFQSAETFEEKLSALKDMEDANVPKEAIAIGYSLVAEELHYKGANPEKVLTCGRKALNILENCDQTNFFLVIAMNLYILGCACYKLAWWSESLGYLERAESLLRKLDEEGHSDEKDLRESLVFEVQKSLAKVKTSSAFVLGRKDDSIGNLRKCLEIQEAMFGKDSREVGDASRELAVAFVELMNFREALPYCIKALEIHELQLGKNSLEVTSDRLLLGVIYTGLEEKEKASEQNQSSQEVLKDQGLNSDLLRVVVDASDMYIKIGKHYEAVQILYDVVPLTDKDSMDRATIFISIAKALGNQEKVADTKKSCLEIACRILGNNESSFPFEVCKAYEDISMEYQEMEDYENAMSLLKKSLSLLENLPQEKQFFGDVTSRIGWLHRLADEYELSITCYEEVVEIYKECFGEMHIKVAYAYSSIASAYDNLGRPESAAPYYLMAQEIMDASYGPHHRYSIKNNEFLSEAYSAIGNFDLAIKFREKAVEGWKAHGPSRKWEMQDNQYILEQLRQKSCIIDEASKNHPPVSYNIGKISAQSPGDTVSPSKKL